MTQNHPNYPQTKLRQSWLFDHESMRCNVLVPQSDEARLREFPGGHAHCIQLTLGVFRTHGVFLTVARGFLVKLVSKCIFDGQRISRGTEANFSESKNPDKIATKQAFRPKIVPELTGTHPEPQFNIGLSPVQYQAKCLISHGICHCGTPIRK